MFENYFQIANKAIYRFFNHFHALILYIYIYINIRLTSFVVCCTLSNPLRWIKIAYTQALNAIECCSSRIFIEFLQNWWYWRQFNTSQRCSCRPLHIWRGEHYECCQLCAFPFAGKGATVGSSRGILCYTLHL